MELAGKEQSLCYSCHSHSEDNGALIYLGFVDAELQGSALFLFLNCSSVHVVADASGYLIGGSPMLKI